MITIILNHHNIRLTCDPCFWRYLLVFDCGRACRLWRNDAGWSAYEHLGRFQKPKINIVGRVRDVWHNRNRHGCQPAFYSVPWFNGIVWNCIDHGTNYHYDLVTGKLRSLYAGACVWPYEFTLFQLLSNRHDSVRATG